MADQPTPPAADYSAASAWVSNLGQELFDQFDTYEKARRMTEERWIDDLYRYRGRYTDEQVRRMDPKRSSVFLRQTRLKVEIFTRLMLQVMLGNNDQTWTLEPDQNPELPAPDLQQIIDSLTEKLNGQSPQQADIDAAVKELANIRARNMERTILSQLDGDSRKMWTGILRQAIHAGNLYGTGIVKGPLVTEKVGTKYRPVIKTEMQEHPDPHNPGQVIQIPVQVQTWEADKTTEYAPYITRSSHWGFYPDPSANNADELQGMYERHIKTRMEMLDLHAREDFDSEAIMGVLEAYPNGTAQAWKTYETELRAIGEDENTYMRVQREKRYEVLEFWGLVTAEELRNAGAPGISEDATGDMWAQVWLMGPVVIKAVLSHLNVRKHPYYFYYFDKDESSFWGEGIAQLSKDPQDILNSATRIMLDNAAICAGPQVELNLDLLEMPNNEDALAVTPFKAWLRVGMGQDAMAAAVKPMTFDSHIQEVNLIRELGDQLMDDISGIPRVDTGDERVGQAAQTATGLSMLMSRSNSMNREQLLRFDDEVQRPLITELVCWNMEFNPDPSIKGSFSIKARGVAGVQAREVRAQQLMQFWQAVAPDPQLRSMVDVNELLRQIAINNEVSEGIVYEKDVYAQIQKQQNQTSGSAVLQQISPVMQKMADAIQQLQKQVQQLKGAASQQPDQDASQGELALKDKQISGQLALQNKKIAGELGIKQALAVGKLQGDRQDAGAMSPDLAGQGDGGMSAMPGSM
jgi:hypothetical protein